MKVFFPLLTLVFGLFPRLWAGPSNVIQNPGFEGEGFWSLNNWAKNEVSGGVVEEGAHSGKKSYRLELVKVLSTPNLQFSQDLAVRPGQAFELRFWMRGKANSKPLNVQFRKGGAPYTTYWQQDVAPSERWTEYVYTAVLSEKTDPADTKFFFNLNEEGGLVWLDDISVTELPPADGGRPLVGNQIANGSFEVGTDHWVARFREAGNHANAGEIATERNIKAALTAPEIDGAPRGKRALRFEVFEQCTAYVSSYFFPLRYGYPATVTFSLKAPGPGKTIEVRLGSGKNSENKTLVTKRFKSEGEGWQSHTFSFLPTVSASRSYFLEWTTGDSGVWWVDAVDVREGEGAPESPEGPSVGWEPVDDRHPGNLFDRGEVARFFVLARGETPAMPLRARVVDYQEKEIAVFDVPVTLSGGLGKTVIAVPTGVFGGFKVEILSPGQELPASEFLYSVVPRLKNPGEVGDSFFGGHFWPTPYNLEIARRAGFRWLRLHPPLPTKWWSIEKEKGKKEYVTAGVERAAAMGFKILGSFDQVPWFYADADPKKPVDSYNRWWNSYPPKDYEAWRAYMVGVYGAFGKWVQTWEIWNEPDGGFLSVPPGKTKESAYLEIAENTSRIAREEKMNITLLGGVVSSLARPFYSNVFTGGLAPLVDGAAFHFYFEDSSPEEAPGTSAVQWAKWTQNLKGRSGKPLEVWHTEGGPFLSDGAAWMRGARVPTSSTLTMADIAGALVRTLASLKAVGVRHHFQYQANAQPSGNRVFGDETSSFIERNSLPFPTLAAHATAVSFLEDLEGQGLGSIPGKGGSISVAQFSKGPKKVLVVWARVPVTLGQVPALNTKGAKAFDLMGNGVALEGPLVIGPAPIYLVWE